ncbi:hypothetical protein BASA81_010044 [Batrachochytrium salamandrivorans]|nr:hypothetical protein BASA81_010044 [Batrachochytrium salamandrivorans]
MLSLEHSLLVGQLSKVAFVLLWFPFILLVSLVLVDALAAVWASFALSMLTQMVDFWLWKARKREYPMVLSAWSLAAYVFVVLLYYTSPHVSSVYYGPIVISILFVAILGSIMLGSPFTQQFQKGITIYTSVHEAGYIMLGIVLPITLPVLGVGCIPCWMRCKRQHTNNQEFDQGIDHDGGNDNDNSNHDEDEEKSSFLRKANN